MDQRITELAQRSPNFGFLLPYEPLLVVYGAGAESAVFADANGALIKCRQFGEVLVSELLRRSGTATPATSLLGRIHALSQAGVATRAMADSLHTIRTEGNAAAHEHLSDRPRALACLEQCFQLAVLLHRAVSADREVRAFVPPQPTTQIPQGEIDRLQQEVDRHRRHLHEARLRLDGTTSRAEAEARARAEVERDLSQAQADREELTAQVTALESRLTGLRAGYDHRAEPKSRISAAQRRAFIDRARRPEPLTEAQTREVIDRKLEQAGWVVQDMGELNPRAALGVAVREFGFSHGRSDYALYVDAQLVGVIEAKREGVPLTEVERQSSAYAAALPKEYSLAAWRQDAPLPFRYESTGVETRFTNRLDPEPRSRSVFSFHRPETIASWMSAAEQTPQLPTLRWRIRNLPDLPEAGLRPAQIEAVRGVEASLAADRPRTLVQMATAAGKTYAAVTLSHRLLAHARARRILFLVDRNHLGDQATAEFRAFTVPGDGRKLDELYNVQRLVGGVVLDSTQVVVTTIQRLHLALHGRPLPGPEDDPQVDGVEPELPADAVYNRELAPEAFDLIVVDECHRSIYGQWRAVLEYFDAPIVGLTATPTAQTLGFFDQNLASQYTYEQAVVDRVNVPFEVYRIKTRIGDGGSTIAALDEEGTRTVVPRRDRRTRMQRYEELEEDFTYTSDQIGRSVLAKDQIRLVIQTFKDRVLGEMYPERSTVPKTLIYAKSDEHADDIVQIVREVFNKGNDFAAKITYRSKEQGNDPKHLLQLLRTSPELRIAVTVDMIATGTDVRPLEAVLFLRGVKSSVAFEQMKGRGARTIEDTEFQQVNPDPNATRKDHFLIVDAVGVTDSPLCEARPLERDRSVSLSRLLGEAANLSISEDHTATLAARLRRLDGQMDEQQREEIARTSGGLTLQELVSHLANAVDPDTLASAEQSEGAEAARARIQEAVRPLTTNPELRQRILDIRREHDTTIDEISKDELREAKGLTPEERARLTITSFEQWIDVNSDQAVIQRLRHGSGPRISYGDLLELANQIKRQPNVVSIERLWTSYAALGAIPNPPKTANPTDLLALLRYALGIDGELRPHRTQVTERYNDWLVRQRQAGVTFTPEQRWYLGHIVEIIVTSTHVGPDDLNGVPFDTQGGSQAFAHTFGPDKAVALLDELNEELSA